MAGNGKPLHIIIIPCKKRNYIRMSPLEFILVNGWLYYNETDTLSVLCPIHGNITSEWNGRRWLG